MERIEYRGVVEKADWPRGPWDNEPDKIQWQDEETGLPCLIVRGPAGALCGYVGVPAGHPLHGKNNANRIASFPDDWAEILRGMYAEEMAEMRKPQPDNLLNAG